MRITTLIFLTVIGVLLLLGVVFHGWVFDHVDGIRQWRGGFGAATTPADAMEKFREAIQQRRYRWAATYCTAEYGNILLKCDDPAGRLGQVIDDVARFMKNRDLHSDRAALVLHYLDPFPGNFKVGRAPTSAGGTEAIGGFIWEPLPFAAKHVTFGSETAGLDMQMLRQPLVPAGPFSTKGVGLVQEGDVWKLRIVPTEAELASVRYFLDHWQAHERALLAFRRDMTNGRYDSPTAFQREVFDALKQARSAP